MSYATDVLRRRQEFKEAFQKRYNPAEDVLATLAEIDKEAFRREQLTAQEKRDVERFGLEKERIVAQTKKAEQDRTASEMALAAQREARKAEFEARAARQREEARLKEQAEARKTGARTLYGRMTGLGQTARDIWGGTAVGDAEKDYATRMARTLAEGTAAEVAKMDEELAAMQAKAPKAVPGGMTMADVEELAGAFGMTPDEALSLADELRREEEARLAELGLTGAKTEQATAAADAMRRRGLLKPAKIQTAGEKTIEDAKNRKIIAEAARAEAKLERDRQIARAGGFAVTKEYGDKLKDRRNSMTSRKSESVRIKELVKKYPDLETYVGPIDQYVSEIRSKMGNEKAAEIMKALGTVFDNYRIAVTGAAAGPTELTMLLKRVPNIGDSLGAILGKLKDDDEYFDLQFRVIDSQLQSGDMRSADAVLGISSTAPIGSAPAPASVGQKPPSATVADAAAEDGVELE
jgi:hypothetical protein